jgi:chromosome segregation ATPase
VAKVKEAPDAEQYEAALEQSKAQILALNERNDALSAFQKEAVDGRDAIAKLQAQLDQAVAERDAATKALSGAEAALKDARQAVESGSSLIGAAQQLADAVKKLS